MQRRNTSQRQIVFDALQQLGHASTEELIEYIRSNYDHISLATIYRNVSILLDEHKIKKVKLQDEDVLETLKSNHYHFVCKECKMIYDVNLKNIFNSLSKVNGHSIEECDISLYGICNKCKEKAINE